MFGGVLEDGIPDDLIVGCSKGQKTKSIVVDLSMAETPQGGLLESFRSSVGVQITGNNDEVGLSSCVHDKLKAVVEFIPGCIQAGLCWQVGRDYVRCGRSINGEDGKGF